MNRLQRWSRQKRGLETATAKDAAAACDETRVTPDAAQHQTTDDQVTDNTAFSDHSLADEQVLPARQASTDVGDQTDAPILPDIDQLDESSDYSAFMAPGVSSGLRRQALRKLWTTGDYNLRDGLNDYDHDFKAQMKPMAAELVDKVRQWSRKGQDQALDDGDDARNRSGQEGVTEETSVADGPVADGSAMDDSAMDGSVMDGSEADDQKASPDGPTHSQ